MGTFASYLRSESLHTSCILEVQVQSAEEPRSPKAQSSKLIVAIRSCENMCGAIMHFSGLVLQRDLR
jgi:hypothetical protein